MFTDLLRDPLPEPMDGLGLRGPFMTVQSETFSRSEAMPPDDWPDYEDSFEDDTCLIDDDGEDE